MYYPLPRMSPKTSSRKSSATTADLARDPFDERAPRLMARSLELLGARFRFESNSRPLLQLALSAFRGLPRHRLSATVPQMRIRLLLVAEESIRSVGRHGRRAAPAPPPLALFSGAGLLGGAGDSSSCVVISPRERAALVVVSPRMLQFPYHTRYELIEFAVYTLAARVRGLVPLHGACVGQGGRGALLVGASGAGKSTVTLQCLLNGLDFLAEDSLFVEPHTMLATAVSAFIHVRSDSLRWVERAADVAAIRNSPVIRRRSGVRKFEVDLRRGNFRLAKAALQIATVVFLSPESGGKQPLLARLRPPTVRSRLTVEQAYAAGQPQWPLFLRNILRLPSFELRRGRHPREAVDALRELLI